MLRELLNLAEHAGSKSGVNQREAVVAKRMTSSLTVGVQ
jgi:hypothetical protein